MTKAKAVSLLDTVENYYGSHITMPDAERTAVALWTMATHVWPEFEAFGYLCITAMVKRAGKTALSECIGFTCANGKNIAGATPAVVFRLIKDGHPVLIVDESESLSSEGAGDMRAILNVGYRRGQTIPRADKKSGVIDWPAYCPKVFVLIGDVNDTLRDRSIVITMQRRAPGSRYSRSQAEIDGTALRDVLAERVADAKLDILKAYSEMDLSFLPDRDAELWAPLMAICAVFAPERMDDVQRVASDLSAMKSMPARSFQSNADAEEAAFMQEMGLRILSDTAAIFDAQGVASMTTVELLGALLDYPLGPWRRFRGEPITERILSDLLRPYAVAPCNIRRGKQVLKGYKAVDVINAVAATGG